jgi:hypothetical protein
VQHRALSLPLRDLLVAGGVAAVVAVAGCGGGQTGKPSTPASTVRAPATSPQAVTIRSPRSGSRLRGRRASSGAIAASVTVTGHAEELQTIRVDGACGARACTKVVYTGPDGGWTARLRLVLAARTRRVTVTADYAVGSDAATGARLTIPIRAAPYRAPTSDGSAGTPAQPGPATTPNRTAPVAPSSPPSGRRRALVLVGDSLAVGVRDLLPSALPGWDVEVLGRVDRPLAEGMGVLAGLDAFGSSATARPVLALSLFTNDDPSHTGALASAVRQTLALVGPRGCVIWATIARPPVNGVSYRAANAVLERLAASDARLVLVPWAEQVAANPELLAADRVHPVPAGYQVRAALYAQAARACRYP